MEIVLVSKCCAGVKCRYRHNGFARKIMDEIGQNAHIMAFCPEQEGGLPTPREGCSVVDGRVFGRRTGTDYTDEYQAGAESALALCEDLEIKKAYLLHGSPSCGAGYGLTARYLEENGVEVVSI